MMSILKQTVTSIHPVDRKVILRAQKKLDNLTKPQGSLGRLEEFAKMVCAVRGDENPVLEKKTIFTLAGDHGVTDEGVSAYPKEVTPQMVYNFIKGGAGINVLARHVGAKIIVADMGVAVDIESVSQNNFYIKKIGRGTKNMAVGPAMTREQAEQSIEAGIVLVEEELTRSGRIDIIGTGDMGIGNTTASSAITAVICGVKPEQVTGKGTGIDDEALTRKVKIIEKSIHLNTPNKHDAIDILSKVGGFEIGGLTGVMLSGAAHKTPVVIDGFISGAAALLAFLIKPEIKDYLFASHCSAERGHITQLEHIGLEPILDLSFRLGEGTGAALAMGIIDAGCKIMTQMATFDSAGVSTKE